MELTDIVIFKKIMRDLANGLDINRFKTTRFYQHALYLNYIQEVDGSPVITEDGQNYVNSLN